MKPQTATVFVKVTDVEPLRAALAALAELHGSQDEDGTAYCKHDGFVWPCATVRILMRLAAGEGDS